RYVGHGRGDLHGTSAGGGVTDSEKHIENVRGKPAGRALRTTGTDRADEFDHARAAAVGCPGGTNDRRCVLAIAPELGISVEHVRIGQGKCSLRAVDLDESGTLARVLEREGGLCRPAVAELDESSVMRRHLDGEGRASAWARGNRSCVARL